MYMRMPLVTTIRSPAFNAVTSACPLDFLALSQGRACRVVDNFDRKDGREPAANPTIAYRPRPRGDRHVADSLRYHRRPNLLRAWILINLAL
jgi:hypothetical protein